MGDAFNEGWGMELPVHNVCITSGFKMAVHEATNAEYAACVSAGICTAGGATSYKNIGASFEYRFARGFRFLASFEPSAACTADQQTAPLTTTERYQAGLDVLWGQEF